MYTPSLPASRGTEHPSGLGVVAGIRDRLLCDVAVIEGAEWWRRHSDWVITGTSTCTVVAMRGLSCTGQVP